QNPSEATGPDSSLLKSFTVDSTNNSITVPGNNFVANQQVTYRAPASATFLTEDVNETYPSTTTASDGTQYDDILRDPKTPGGAAVHTSNNDIIIPNHGFNTGDAVTYTYTGGLSDPIGGLTSGQTYFVIKVDSNTIQLASSYYQAVGLPANP